MFSPKKSTASRITLIQILNRETKDFLAKSVYLKALENGKLSKEQWQVFLIQRLLAGAIIETLLETGIACAKKAGDVQLEKAFQDNLNDETGIDANGKFDPTKAHSNWRRDFYHALEIEDTQYEKTKPLASTLKYRDFVEKLAKREDVLEIAGALLILERSIPPEFERVRDGRNKTFPDLFVDQPGDSETIRDQKFHARQYIDDHIIHDANAHYPDLLAALEKYADDRKAMHSIVRGTKLLKIKVGMYKELEKLRQK